MTDDVRMLVQAAAGAARKMKVEYDRLCEETDGGPPPADECWAECGALWHALEPFGFYLDGGRLIDGHLGRQMDAALRATRRLTEPNEYVPADDRYPF
jgi:hypothetical protein